MKKKQKIIKKYKIIKKQSTYLFDSLSSSSSLKRKKTRKNVNIEIGCKTEYNALLPSTNSTKPSSLLAEFLNNSLKINGKKPNKKNNKEKYKTIAKTT